MTDPKSNDEDDPSGPQTPQNASTPKKQTPNTATGATPIAKATTPSKDGTPKTAPAAGRARAATTRQPPSLLGDFLLGRPSAARVAADRKAAREAAHARRMSLEMVKQEMRQASVMRIQAPGGVHDRVKKWQKTNAAAMASADPLATPSEPSEVNIQVDEESVTEEDRVRIKSRQRKPKPKSVAEQGGGDEASSRGYETDSKLSNPPKKRVVSDTNWVKNKKSPPKPRSPKTKPKSNESTGSPLPKDFLARTAANPSVSKKIKDWASKVEIPEETHGKQHRASKSTGSLDGIRVKPIPSGSDSVSGRSASTRITIKMRTPQKPKIPDDDGIRVTPMPSENDAPSERSGSSRVAAEPSKARMSKGLEDDGIRVTPLPSENDTASGRSSTVHSVKQTSSRKSEVYLDDGIRVKPLQKQARQSNNVRYKPRKAPIPNDQATASSYLEGSDDGSTVRASSRRSSRIQSTHETSTHRDRSPSDYIKVLEEPESDAPRTPKPVDSSPAKSNKKLPTRGRADTSTVLTEDVSDSESWSSDSVSDMPFSIPPQSLADIPVGYSAFSELDLPSGPKTRNARPKTKRQSSFKGATSVLKKALTEGKKILSEKAEPPKPAHNRPPNIETWLKDTVDPFVDSPTAPPREQKESIEEEWVDEGEEDQTEDSMLSSRILADSVSASPMGRSKEVIEPREIIYPDLNPHNATTPTSAGLKRSRATRITSSPSKSSNKRGLKEKLKDAFRGESTGHNPPPLEYPSCSEVVDLDEKYEDEYRERRRSSGTRKTPPFDDYESSISSSSIQPAPPPAYHKRKPPTNGHHELSTIASEGESHSTLPSDYSSIISDSTITDSTVLTRSTAVSRKRSQKSGLKRRLTKHSDLISVLSLPDDASESHRTSSLRSARSVRRSSNHLGSATIDGLALEFEDDEDLYQRELKTLVEGVIPVLLTEFVNNNSSARKDLFGSAPAKYKEDTLDNAVVNMGIALDDLRDKHRRRPSLSDIRRFPHWLEMIHPIYNNYLDVWRLGFQGIIVNLAPKSPDDLDSLINAMPRNEQGDILDEDGERIDVAHLLRRPLLRIKWITKFIRGYRAITGTRDFEALATKWEALQEKVKRRFKEENARVVDEDAKNSDTSRARDLKTLEALDHVRIDRFRQVFAKDTFSLDLQHSNGQRLECQVELIFRDNQLFGSDPGDLLIRQTDSGGRSWLLFAPVVGGRFSARKGDSKHEVVVMIRGFKDEWYELLSLWTDDQDQAQDWVDILGQNPVPPAIKRSASQSLAMPPKSATPEIPLGERKLRNERIVPPAPHRSSQSPEGASRAHERTASNAKTRASSPEETLTRDSYSKPKRTTSSPEQNDEAYTRSYSSPEPSPVKQSPNSKPYREDGAPPPPVHRSFSSKKHPVLSPPADQNTPKIKRRTSSPLKHEYHPSDVSSEGSASPSPVSGDDSMSDSSDDELEAAEIPDTTPAISIKRDSAVVFEESYVSRTTASITPSASASQAGAPKTESKQPAYVIQSVASISYWDDKHGRWQDLWPDLCSILTMPGLIEAYPHRRARPSPDSSPQEERPLIALDLTPLVMLRNSTVVDLEIKSPVLTYSRLYSKVVKHATCMFRFRMQSIPECQSLYVAVHKARLDNAKYKALEEEARVRAFGQNQNQDPDEYGSSQRRGWFGRKNSYRVSARAPSQSANSASQNSGVSASSFLKRLMRGGNQSFNIAMSSVDRQNRFAGHDPSLYTSSSSATSPRSPSVSLARSGSDQMSLTTNNLKIRLHLLKTASKWEDHGNCMLEVTRPDRGTRQNLRKYQGMEKRIIVSTIPKKDTQKPVIVLDVVLGSQCFSRLGSRGVLLNVWEEVKDEKGQTGVVPQGGGSGGNIRKWCLQCGSVQQAAWIFGLVTQEVVIG